MFNLQGFESPLPSDDNCKSCDTLTHQIFYVLMILLLVLLFTLVIFPVIERRYPGAWIPPFFKFPTFHIRICLVVSLGMLDSASEVLFDVKSNPGWKLLGALIVASALVFVGFFLHQGRAFAAEHHFAYDRDFPKEIKFLSLDGLYFMYKRSFMEIGHYRRTDGGDVNYPFGVFFNTFAPSRQ